jgi:hypothetical protein
MLKGFFKSLKNKPLNPPLQLFWKRTPTDSIKTFCLSPSMFSKELDKTGEKVILKIGHYCFCLFFRFSLCGLQFEFSGYHK